MTSYRNFISVHEIPRKKYIFSENMAICAHNFGIFINADVLGVANTFYERVVSLGLGLGWKRTPVKGYVYNDFLPRG